MKKWIWIIALLLTTACSAGNAVSDSDVPTDAVCRTISYYDYGAPVIESTEVQDDWFNDAIIIGDMRVGSLALYTDLASRGAEIIYDERLGIYSMKTSTIQMSSATAYDALLQSDRKKIYLWLGINELVYDSDDWASVYAAIVSEIIQSHKDAEIYLLGEYHPLSINSMDGEALRAAVDAHNQALQKIAKENRIYYVDMSEALDGKDGVIDDSYVWGGYSLNPDGALKAVNYLSSHIVKEKEHVKTICE